jgi:hypothetical protein
VEAAAARAIRRWTVRLLVLALVATAVAMAIGYARRHPEDLPWTALDLTRPIGMFTGRKLAALGDDPPLCRRLLGEAGIRFELAPPRAAGPNCSVADALSFGAGGARALALQPDAAEMSCPVAAALSLWEWHVVQPAAARHFGTRVAAVEHLGTYNCRRIRGGREDAGWSEHATANAIDVSAFRLESGQRVSILNHWNGSPEERAFLREVRDGACRLFATVLSPEYNAAHRDHLHLDQARRGASGWRGCR